MNTPGRRDTVVFIIGATGTGKSRLAVDLALLFDGEVINSDKMQFYEGLDITTNKITVEERRGVPHHLLGILPPHTDFTAVDFRHEALALIDSIAKNGRLPIVAGGSNSYIQELVEGGGGELRRRYRCCFIWIDVEQSVLHEFVGERVECMVARGLVEEVRGLFNPQGHGDYLRGIRRAIGVPELDEYLRAEASLSSSIDLVKLLKYAVDEIKANTCKLSQCQVEKINRMSELWEWNVKRVDATEVFERRGRKEACDEAWQRLVVKPNMELLESEEQVRICACNCACNKERNNIGMEIVGKMAATMAV